MFARGVELSCLAVRAHRPSAVTVASCLAMLSCTHLHISYPLSSSLQYDQQPNTYPDPQVVPSNSQPQTLFLNRKHVFRSIRIPRPACRAPLHVVRQPTDRDPKTRAQDDPSSRGQALDTQRRNRLVDDTFSEIARSRNLSNLSTNPTRSHRVSPATTACPRAGTRTLHSGLWRNSGTIRPLWPARWMPRQQSESEFDLYVSEITNRCSSFLEHTHSIALEPQVELIVTRNMTIVYEGECLKAMRGAWSIGSTNNLAVEVSYLKQFPRVMRWDYLQSGHSIEQYVRHRYERRHADFPDGPTFEIEAVTSKEDWTKLLNGEE